MRAILLLNCVVTDSLFFTSRGVAYAQPVEWFAHGAVCDSLAVAAPHNFRWI